MAVIERERAPSKPERAVFVASDGRRARRLRRAGFAAAFVACLWVVGLGVGMLGSGSLPGVSVVKEQLDEIVGTPDAHGSQPAEKNVSAPASRRSAPVAGNRLVARSSQVAAQSPARTRRVRSRPAPRPPAQVATPPPPAAQAPVNPATRQRGWSRKGSTAPPGKVRQTVTPPPPATRGQRHGQDSTEPAHVPSGQQKKAEALLLPPPPPKKA